MFRILFFLTNYCTFSKYNNYGQQYYYNYFLLLLLAISASQCASSVERPFYNIAHMVNSIKEINYYISRGANAIEADVSFSPNGTALYTYHGYPCDCFRHCNEREDIEKYLRYIRDITKPGKLISITIS